MPIYDYICSEGHVTTQRGSYDDAEIVCLVDVTYEFFKDKDGRSIYLTDPCLEQAHRRPFSTDYGVSGLPTRGPIVPAPPAPRSTSGEESDTVWGEIMDTQAHEQHEHAKKYGRGGELADRYDERPKTSRE